jgi:hypothetical protein
MVARCDRFDSRPRFQNQEWPTDAWAISYRAALPDGLPEMAPHTRFLFLIVSFWRQWLLALPHSRRASNPAQALVDAGLNAFEI